MLESNLCNYSDACILGNGNTTITGGAAAADAPKRKAEEINKGVIFKNCAPFTDMSFL